MVFLFLQMKICFQCFRFFMFAACILSAACCTTFHKDKHPLQFRMLQAICTITMESSPTRGVGGGCGGGDGACSRILSVCAFFFFFNKWNQLFCITDPIQNKVLKISYCPSELLVWFMWKNVFVLWHKWFSDSHIFQIVLPGILNWPSGFCYCIVDFTIIYNWSLLFQLSFYIKLKSGESYHIILCLSKQNHSVAWSNIWTCGPFY